MLRLARAATVVCAAILFALPSLGAENKASLRAALDSIAPSDLSGFVDVLASDAMAGRESGTKGGRAAADYMAREFEVLGLAPGGDNGTYYQAFAPNFRNVIGVLRGNDPKLKDQYLLVGAHYDHVGYGNARTSRGGIGTIHRGADDNASGSAAMLELAKAMALLPSPPRRTIIFLALDAEEKGLLGSKHFGAHPTVPLDKTVAMIDVDMVGRVRNNNLIVYGTRSGYGMRRLVAEQNAEVGLDLQFSWNLTEQGDHYSFFKHDLPVLMLHSGVHDDYHTSRDVPALLNTEGMASASKLLLLVACELANRDEPPRLRRFAARETDEVCQQLKARAPRLPSRLGIQWESASSSAGARISGVTADSPAAKADLHRGDCLLEVNGRPIHGDDELSAAICTAENPAKLLVRRAGGGEPVALEATLNGPPLRLGITWQSDDASPGVAVLTHVLCGSPAAVAGLSAGDQIYQVDGRDFAGEEQFLQLIRDSGDAPVLMVERNGHIRTVTLKLKASG